MQGEFRGDFTRDTYNPSKQFLQVFTQQGRVQLDADWNEQVSILLGYMQTLATDLIGPYGGPKNNCGFEIITVTELDDLDTFFGNHSNLTQAQKEQIKQLKERLDKSKEQKKNFLIGAGHYYVQGKLCGSQSYILYSDLPEYPFTEGQATLKDGDYLVYLDVWERHITHIEDESELIPGIREVALGKADTTTRSQLIWQIKIKPIDEQNKNEFVKEIKKNPIKLREIIKDDKKESTRNEIKPGTGLLKAQANKPAGADANNPCTISPDSRYRGAENQLYRVEIHTSGTAGKATFKWSRENGSVIFPVQQPGGTSITLGHLGWDDRSSLKPGDWVELVDDHYDLQGRAEPLQQIDPAVKIDPTEPMIKLKHAFSYSINDTFHPLLRRWDQQETSDVKLPDGAIPVSEGKWIELENGVEICFSQSQPQPEAPNFYATGDYWLIPARTATGDVEWPKERQGNLLDPIAVPPHGVEHHYAPLWIISVDDNAITATDGDCRCQFLNLCSIISS